MAQDFMRIDVRHDLARVKRELRHFGKSVPQAMTAALNKTAAGVRTDAGKPLSKLTGLGVNKVKQAIKLRKASPGHLAAVLEARGRPLNMIRFMTSQQKRAWLHAKKRPRPPIKIGTKRKAPWGKVRNKYRKDSAIFIGNAGRTVFVRDGKRRLDIHGMWGPSLPREMVNKEVFKAIDSSFHKRWEKEIAAAIRAVQKRTLGKRR